MFQKTASKGIVMSVYQFEGNVTISDSTVAYNMVNIPTGIYTNYPKFNQKIYDPHADIFIKRF